MIKFLGGFSVTVMKNSFPEFSFACLTKKQDRYQITDNIYIFLIYQVLLMFFQTLPGNSW